MLGEHWEARVAPRTLLLTSNSCPNLCVQIRLLQVGLLYAGNQEQIPLWVDFPAVLSSLLVTYHYHSAWELYASHTQSTMTEIFKETFCYKKVDIRFLGAWYK